MSPLSRLSKPLLASALLLSCIGASAATPSATGQAVISHLQFGVIDLTPNDSQAAHYTLAFTNVVGDAAVVTTGADGVLDGLKVQGSMAANEPPGQYADWDGRIFYHLTLSAHSVLTLGGHMLTADNRFGNPAPGRIDGEGRASVTIVLADGSASLSTATGQTSTAVGGDTVTSKERDFLLAFANSGDIDQDVVVQVSSNVSYSIPQVVPEPHTYALMLAGLMAVPLMRRRQARHQGRNAT